MDDEETMAAHAIVQARIAQYSPDNQYNCDETGLFWKAMPERSLSTHRISGIKADKARITLHFCANASSTHKLKPWIIGRFERPTRFRAAGIHSECLECIYRWNRKRWMRAEIFTEWLRWFDRQMTGRKTTSALTLQHTTSFRHCLKAIGFRTQRWCGYHRIRPARRSLLIKGLLLRSKQCISAAGFVL